MIFNVLGHIEMIRNGLRAHPPLAAGLPHFMVKTQTRRVNRGIYQVGKDYAVQSKRGVQAEEDIRIVMDKIWEEDFCIGTRISAMDALAEGGYYPIVFEEVFRAANPKWDRMERWAFKFHVIEVQK